MVQDTTKQQNITTYEIDNKKYTVVTRCIDNSEELNKLYDVLCKFVMDKLTNV